MQNEIKKMCFAEYGILVKSVSLLQDGSDNLVYQCQTDTTKYVLRISKKQKSDEDFLQIQQNMFYVSVKNKKVMKIFYLKQILSNIFMTTAFRLLSLFIIMHTAF